jgi:p-aminobenzoyl-glutamate transporter AbgT
MTGEQAGIFVIFFLPIVVVVVVSIGVAWIHKSSEKNRELGKLHCDLMLSRLDLGQIKFAAESPTATDSKFRYHVREMLKDFNP